MQESSIFKAAVKLPIHERAAYLDQACGVNAALRLEVEGLLRAHEQPGEFMFRPPIADMATDYRPGPDRPGTRIGPYKLLQYLGEGGMGTVFLAEQSQPVRRMVALKIIKPGMDSNQILARFEAERQALAIMDHPNIAKVFDAGTTQTGLELPPKPQNGTPKDEAHNKPTHTYNGPSKGGTESIPVGRPYFVMELVKGVPITEFCDKNKLTTKQRLELFIPVCNAIQHAHMKGIIHRDIKPSNVLIALYDGKPVPKVIDFGVAKAMSEPLTQRTMFTQIGQIVGTFEYMSPEQATLNQLDIDTRSDIYSLGVLLYELLTGMTPLNKDKLRTLALDQMLKTIREEEPMRPSMRLSSEAGALAVAAAYRNVPSSKLQGVLRGELDWIVMKCLEKERSRRFVTAGSLAEDIERYLRDEPVTACPPSLAYRAQKAYRKNKLAIFVTSLIGAVLLVATAISILFALNANRARLQAVAAEEETSRKHDIAEKAKSDAEAERDKNAIMVKKLSATEEERRRNQYDWDFQIMQTAYDTGRVGQVQQMLSRHAEDLRGFEWYYWNKQIHGEQRTLKFTNDKSVVIRDPNRSPGPGGGGDATQWVMNELGTRVACVSYELQGEELTDPVSKRPSQPRAYFVDIFDCADGRRLCHVGLHAGSTATPRMSHLIFNRDGSRLAVAWTYVQLNPSSQPEKSQPRTTTESLFKVIDVATSNSIYDVNLGTSSVGPGGLSGAQMPLFFPDGKRLALVVPSPGRQSTFSSEGENFAARNLPTSQVRIIDLQSQPGKEIGRFETSNNSSPFVGLRNGSVLAISPDGSRIAHLKDIPTDAPASSPTLSRSYILATVDASTGKELHSWPITDKVQFPMLAFSPDSRRLALAHMNIIRPNVVSYTSNLTLSMREADTGKELYKEVVSLENQAGAPPAGAALFSPDGKILYLRNGVINTNIIGRVWAFHTDTGKPLAGFDGDFTLGQCVFSPINSTRLYQVDANAVVIRDALTGKALQTLRSHVQNITCLGMAADGRTISTLDNTGEYKVWNTTPARPIVLRGLPSNSGPSFSSTTSRLSPDGHYVVGVPENEDKTNPKETNQFNIVNEDVTRLALWDATNGRMQHLPLRPMLERPKETNLRNTPSTSNLLQFTSNSRFVSLVRYRNYRSTGFARDGSERLDPQKTDELDRYNFSDLTVWDTATGQETAYLQLPAVSGFRNSIIWLTPDGKTAAMSSGTETTLTAYDLATGRELWNKAPAEKGERSLSQGTVQAMSPDGKVVLRFLRVFDVDEAGRAGRAVNNNIKYELIETANGRLIRSFEKPYEAFSSSIWSPDGKRIALITNRGFGPERSGGKMLRVFDLETGEQVMNLDSPPGSTTSLVNTMFSPDGRRIVARMSDRNLAPGGSQSSIRIWDAATGNELLTLPADRLTSADAISATTQLAFSADGYRIVEFLPRPGNRVSSAANPVYCAVRTIDATPVKK